MQKAIDTAKRFFEDLYNNTATVVGVNQDEDGWELLVEVITDDEYTRKRAKGDLLSVFKAYMTRDMKIVSYSREEIRERGKPLSKIE